MELLERALAAVREEFLGKASTLDYRWWRSTTGLDAPRLDVWFTVETDSDLAIAKRHALHSQLDEVTRTTLARNGYLRQTRDVIAVSLWSREALDRGDWR